VFIDSQNKTSDKTIIAPVGKQLNISTMYFNSADNHISNADVYLTGEGLTEDFKENRSLNLYYLNFNTSKLKLGDNYLKINAEKNNYISQSLEVAIILRKINSTISTVDSSEVIETQPGEDVNISITLNNNDFGGNIKNATVTYTWEQGSGILKDTNNDGVYEVTVENVPEGTFNIKISAFAGDDYEIQDYEITISSYVEGGGGLNWVIYILVGAMAGISGYIVLYQKVLRYPPTVRKVRKLRKRIHKNKTLKPMKVKDRTLIVQKSLTDKKSHEILKQEEDKIPNEDKITEKLEDSKVIKIDEETKDSPKNSKSAKN